jgi:UDP-N-acetylmuramate--alanine ligase
MVVTGLRALGQDPSFVNGGVIAAYGSSAESGDSELFVIEADESDGSFLHYKTAVALITNVDPDHLDHYGSLENFEAEFARFANGASDFIAISSDDPGAVRVSTLITGKRILRFGFASDADVKLHSLDATGPQVSFTISFEGVDHSATLNIAGEHNAVNAAGAGSTSGTFAASAPQAMPEPEILGAACTMRPGDPGFEECEACQ